METGTKNRWDKKKSNSMNDRFKPNIFIITLNENCVKTSIKRQIVQLDKKIKTQLHSTSKKCTLNMKTQFFSKHRDKI